jgi:DNA-binding MarR family transcriptional regulator
MRNKKSKTVSSRPKTSRNNSKIKPARAMRQIYSGTAYETGVTTAAGHDVKSSDLTDSLGFCLHRTTLRLKESIESELKPYGINVQQLGLMCLLERSGTLSQVGVGSFMHIDKATMVKLIDGLESSGYINRASDEGDRRIKRLEMTTKGKREIKPMRAIRKACEAKLLKPLSAKEAGLFRSLLVRLLLATT